MQKEQGKNKKPLKHTVILAAIAAVCIIMFAIVMGVLLFSQGEDASALHTLAQGETYTQGVETPAASNPSQLSAATEWPDGLDVQVLATSEEELSGVLKAEEVLPIAQEVAGRVFGQRFNGFVMLGFEEEAVFNGPVWRVYAYVGEEDSVDLYLDAKTGRDLSCVLEPNRWHTSESVSKMNEQAAGDWNVYTPTIPPEYRAEIPEASPSPDDMDPEQAKAALVEWYETLKQETLAFIESNRNDPGIERARSFASESGLLGEASIVDAWLLMREEGDSMYGYGLFSTYEVKLDNGEWLVLGERDHERFFSYSRPSHSQVEWYELEIEQGGVGQ